MFMVGKEQNIDVPASKNGLSLTSIEIRYLRYSWEKANSVADIGCEVVAGLLNDNRTRFRALIESHSNNWLGAATFTAEDVKKFQRAYTVAKGVSMFFNKASYISQ
ncbi:hypothetical protein KIN20_023769 [Parelaphostrongylus tenuis]|uniref:Uncharacterized protein n=1 Tax=Parelaphostrongylus tenuis TaxID=148309 RepID=A0AAD5NCE5_PARTN|nr:hypothetical protein KIN20_023769 [Parelaphostrongylus tenuis]